jgi:hypothetical protein
MSAPRIDLYKFIHKGLRAFMTHALVRVGRLDPHDAAEVAEVAEEVRVLMDICAAHGEHENRFVHPAMEERRPGSTRAIADDHEDHLRAIAELRALVDRLSGDDAAAHALYRALGAFVAHNLDHMAQEETAHNAVLWATHSDAELLEIEGRIRGSLTPREMQRSLHWMVPHMSPAERAAMLRGMRGSAPPEVFAGVLALLRPLLGGRDWRKLNDALAS